MHCALGKAVELHLTPRNPAASARPPEIRQEEITPLDAEQARALLEAAKGDRFECLYVLSLTCGIRMGEALGLKWSDVDFEAGTIRVHCQLQRMRNCGGLVFSEPKNASRRTVDLPQRAVEALRRHRERQAEEPTPSRRKSALCSILALCNSSASPILSSSAIVCSVSYSVDWSQFD